MTEDAVEALGPEGQRLRELFEDALAEVLRDAEYEGVYLGPWWSSPSSRAAGEPHRTWKRAVLRRRSRGAEHWGHLFLIEGTVAPRVEVISDRTLGPGRGALQPPSVFAVQEGPVRASLVARASSGADAGALERLAQQILARIKSRGALS